MDTALAGFGLYQAQLDEPDDPDAPAEPKREDRCYLWPCNVATFNIWCQVQTQWAHDAAGAKTGLRYGDVAGYLRDVVRIKPKDFRPCFAGLQAMERAALEEWAKLRRDK